MHALILALILIAMPALADVAGTATVIDGDTLEIQGQRIRLHGIDSPESRQLCRLDGKPWQCGKDAEEATTSGCAWVPYRRRLIAAGADRAKRSRGHWPAI